MWWVPSLSFVWITSLIYFLKQRDLNERQQKWANKVQAFDFDIEYVKEKNNAVAIALSMEPAIYLVT